MHTPRSTMLARLHAATLAELERAATLPKADAADATARALTRWWRVAPESFVVDALGMRMWEGQRRVVEAVRQSRRVAVRSGHKLGKSTVAAAIAVWFATLHADSQVVITSVKADQIDDTIWREVKRLARELRRRLAEVADVGEPNTLARNGWNLPNGSRVYGRTAGKGEGFAGISGTGETLLFIVDEASGIRPEIFEVIEGNRAGGAGVLMIGNPTQPSGAFYDAFHAHRQLWTTLHLSTLDVPNVRQPDALDLHVPGLATPGWVAEKRKEWFGTPAWDVRVLGNFSAVTTDTFLSLVEVEQAVDRWRAATDAERAALEGTSETRIGVDVGRYGDDPSVIQPVRGRWAYQPTRLPKLDLASVAGHVLNVAREHHRPGETLHVLVDGVGLGAGVVDILRSMRSDLDLGWLRIHDVNGQSPDDAERYADLRTQLHAGAASWVADGGALPPVGDLEGELVGMKYGHDARGRQRLEPKDRTKKRIGRSPDYADALALATYQGDRFSTDALDAIESALPKSEAARIGRYL